MCSRCGHEVPYKRLREEWTGLWVCPDCYDPKHEQLTPPTYVHDPQALEHPWPDNDNKGGFGGEGKNAKGGTPLASFFDMHHGDTSFARFWPGTAENDLTTAAPTVSAN